MKYLQKSNEVEYEDDFRVSDKSIIISPKDFITVTDLNAKMFATALLKWYFNVKAVSAEKIVDDFVEHLNKKE